MTDESRDRVERSILIRASVERAFAGITDPAKFPSWGPIAIEGMLAPGEKPLLDFGPQGGGKVRVHVEAFEPPRYFAFWWAQGVTDPVKLLEDPLQGHPTLVEFHVEEASGGARVRVVESGLSKLPGHPGLDPDKAREHMGKGYEIMLNGLRKSIDEG